MKLPDEVTNDMGYKVNNLIYAAGPELIGTLRMGLIITDGNGLFPFLKTILYYYLSELHLNRFLGCL